MKRIRDFFHQITPGLGSFVSVYIPILVLLGGIIGFYIGFLTDAPVFEQPKYQFVTRKSFINYDKSGQIYRVPGIYECIINESNEWIGRSLIELAEVRLDSGIAFNTRILLDVYDSFEYTETGDCYIIAVVPDTSTSHITIDLKTFEKGRTLYLPLSISVPLYDEQSGQKNYSSEELNNMDKAMIQYRPRYIEYQNGKWQQVPILKHRVFKMEFEGMKISNPISLP